MRFDELGGWPATLGTLLEGHDMDAEHARAAMREILDGAATPAQIAGFVVALRAKGETTAELSGLVDAILDVAEQVPLPDGLPVIDVVGTGGDQANTINVSTLAALVVAGAGGYVCKHGNRASSSATGTADLLEALGVRIDSGPETVARCVIDTHIGFCFAPLFHPAFRHAGPPRRELGIPTVFNMLGPLANPARVRRLVVGVSDGAMATRMIEVLAARGCERALVVHGDDGLDELTTSTTSQVAELRDGEVHTYRLDPTDFGLPKVDRDALVGGDPATNAELARRVLVGETGPHRDIVCLNAAGGLIVAGLVDDFASGIDMARAAIDGGGAAAALKGLSACSNAP